MLQKKNLFAYLLLALAVIALIFAIVCFSSETSYLYGSTKGNNQYGGDAYTGIQNAAAQTATNVYYLNRNVEILTSCIATVGGLFFLLVSFVFAVFGVKQLGLTDCTAEPEKATETTETTVVVEETPTETTNE